MYWDNCKECGARLEYKDDDIGVYKFWCPNCKQEIRLKAKDILVSPRAIHNFYKEAVDKIERWKNQMHQTSLNILVFGPSKKDLQLYKKREDIKAKLRIAGHAAYFSEDEEIRKLTQEVEKYSSLLDAEELQARAMDVIVVLATSWGSISELSAFSQKEDIAKKMFICIDKAAKEKGFIKDGILKKGEKLFKYTLYFHPQEEINSCKLAKKIIEKMEGLRITKFLKKGGFDLK